MYLEGLGFRGLGWFMGFRDLGWLRSLGVSGLRVVWVFRVKGVSGLGA